MHRNKLMTDPKIARHGVIYRDSVTLFSDLREAASANDCVANGCSNDTINWRKKKRKKKEKKKRTAHRSRFSTGLLLNALRGDTCIVYTMYMHCVSFEEKNFQDYVDALQYYLEFGKRNFKILFQ